MNGQPSRTKREWVPAQPIDISTNSSTRTGWEFVETGCGKALTTVFPGRSFLKIKFALLVPIVCLGVASMVAKADTLTLNSGTVNPAGGSAEIYPYSFQLDTSSGASTVNLMCLNYNREITAGETWSITEEGIPTGNSLVDLDYRADAILYAEILNPPAGVSASEIQYAEWSIFDPSDRATSASSLCTSLRTIRPRDHRSLSEQRRLQSRQACCCSVRVWLEWQGCFAEN